MSLDDFLDDFGLSICERLDSGRSRDVYVVEGHFLDERGFEGDQVLKHAVDGDGFQNKREARAYLEMLERGQNFLPEVRAGNESFQYLIVDRVNPLDTRSESHPWHENPRVNQVNDECLEILPEGWYDKDDLEICYDDELKIVDGGTLFRQEWIIGDLFQHDSVNTFSRNGSEYFEIIRYG